MCRLFAITSEDPRSPMVALEAWTSCGKATTDPVSVCFLRDLGGPFEDIKDAPIYPVFQRKAGLRRWIPS
jgi:hypothetical protein